MAGTYYDMLNAMGYGSPMTQPGATGQAAPQVDVNSLVDPKTGKLLKVPQNLQEMQAAQLALEQYGNQQAQSNWQEELDFAKKPIDTEAIINKGTEELGESQTNANLNLQQQAAAMGFGSSGDKQAGNTALATDFAGKRANLARDVRQHAGDESRRMMMEAYGHRPISRYNLAGLYGMSGGGGGGGAGGGGAHYTGWSFGGGSIPAQERSLDDAAVNRQKNNLW